MLGQLWRIRNVSLIVAQSINLTFMTHLWDVLVCVCVCVCNDQMTHTAGDLLLLSSFSPSPTPSAVALIVIQFVAVYFANKLAEIMQQ